MKKCFLLLIALVVFLSGCAFNISLAPSVQPLQERTLAGEGRPKILLMDVTGFISEKEKTSGLTPYPSMVTEIKEALKKAEEDGDIAGVVLRINSPGGTVAASDTIRHELMAFKNRRGIPVYAFITGLGASGGYYVATAADRIIAQPSAITGSIGVLVLKFNAAGLLSKIGVEEEIVKSGDKKDILLPHRPNTPEEKEILQGIIDALHGGFVEAVLEARDGRLKKEDIERFSDGRPLTARQALEAGLIDSTGYFEDAIEAVRKDRGLDGARVVYYYRPGSYRETVYAGSGILGLLSERAFADTEFLYLWMP